MPIFRDSPINQSMNQPNLQQIKLAKLGNNDQSSTRAMISNLLNSHQAVTNRGGNQRYNHYVINNEYATSSDQNSRNVNQSVPLNIGKTVPITQRVATLKAQGNANKSFTFQSQNKEQLFHFKEHPTTSGTSGVYACGPLTRKRYINPKLEKELVDFKKEVEEKFGKSLLKTFLFPRIQDNSIEEIELTQDPHEQSSYLLEQEQLNKGNQQKQPKTGRRYLLDHTQLMNYSSMQDGNSSNITTRNQVSDSFSIDQHFKVNHQKQVKSQASRFKKPSDILPQLIRNQPQLPQAIAHGGI